MKKFLKLFSVFALLVFICVFAFACKKDKDQGNTPADGTLDGTYNVTVWVSDIAGVKELTEAQIAKFNEANPGIVINATVEKVGEGEAATQMVTSVEDGADLFCFAQDQLSRLVQAAALNPLGVEATKTVKDLNDEGSVRAASVNDQVYCYPLTSDNGYFMFYDKRVITEDIVGDLEAIVKKCEDSGKNISFKLEGSGWYNASFFFALGLHSNWTTDNNGKFVSIDDNFNSADGVKALKAMQKVLKSKNYVDSESTADFEAAIPSAVVVSGTWDSGTAKKILGDNLGVAELPSFTLDGQKYHLGSFSGNKLMGVKPQTDVKRAAVLQKLALYLTGKECQLERFAEVGWGPSNKEAQADPAVAADPALNALAAQSKYAIPQGQIHGSWWDISKTYATAAREASTDADLEAALASYEESINGLFSMPVDEQNAFTVIGKFDGHNWDFDVTMEQKPANTWMTTEPIPFAAGDEFKVRQGKSWDVNFGDNGENVKVEEAGSFYVKFVYDPDAKTGVITLEKVNPNYGWTVIGAFEGHNWDFDAYMEPDSNGIWTSVNAITFAAGEEFKVRQGLSWDVSYGDGTANFKVETAGTYFVTFDPVACTVGLVPAE